MQGVGQSQSSTGYNPSVIRRSSPARWNVGTHRRDSPSRSDQLAGDALLEQHGVLLGLKQHIRQPLIKLVFTKCD